MTLPSLGSQGDDASADPEVRLTAFVFARAFGDPPVGAWRAPGALMLLGSTTAALTVALPWGAIVAIAPLPDARDLDAYSMNHHTQAFRTPIDDLDERKVPGWAVPCVRVLRRAGCPGGLRIVVNRELPDETGLLSGAETACALGLALGQAYGLARRAPDPSCAPACTAGADHAVLSHTGSHRHGVELLPCDLASAGLRLVLIDVGAAEAPPGASAAPGFGGDVEVAASALRSGDPSRLGPLLTEAHEPGVDLLDRALAAAWSAGALGGRAIGSCLVVLAPLGAVPAIRYAVTDQLAGMARRAPRLLTATGAAGAHRAL
jgi:galactokinase